MKFNHKYVINSRININYKIFYIKNKNKNRIITTNFLIDN